MVHMHFQRKAVRISLRHVTRCFNRSTGPVTVLAMTSPTTMDDRPSSSRTSAPLNIPAGNSTITPDARTIREEDQLSGDTLRDVKTAFSASVSQIIVESLS